MCVSVEAKRIDLVTDGGVDSSSKVYSQRKSNKMQQCIKILFHMYMKLNMFRATHRPSSEA
jgi:hypothetical protein